MNNQGKVKSYNSSLQKPYNKLHLIRSETFGTFLPKSENSIQSLAVFGQSGRGQTSFGILIPKLVWPRTD